MGGGGEHTSGDLFLAFATGNSGLPAAADAEAPRAVRRVDARGRVTSPRSSTRWSTRPRRPILDALLARRDDGRLRRRCRRHAALASREPLAETPSSATASRPAAARRGRRDAARPKRSGYDRFGIWDSPALFREPWVDARRSVARDHERIALGTWVTNRLAAPGVTAACAATVDDLAPGPRLHRHRSRRHRRLALRARHRDARASWRRTSSPSFAAPETGSASGRATSSQLQWAGARRIPIVMAAHASRSLRLAGRIADGVVIGLGVSADVVARLAGATRGRGARSRSRRSTTSTSGSPVSGGSTRSPAERAPMEPGRRPPSPSTSRDSGVEDKFIPDEHRRPRCSRSGRRYDLIATAIRTKNRRLSTSSSPIGSASATTCEPASCSRAHRPRSRLRSAPRWTAGAATSTARSTPTSPSIESA